MESFTDMTAWKKGVELMKAVYDLAAHLPKEEQYGISTQMKKSSTSILANFAEGFSRQTAADKLHKYVIARGECSETQAFLHMCVEPQFLTAVQITHALELSQEVGKMLSGLIRTYGVDKES